MNNPSLTEPEVLPPKPPTPSQIAEAQGRYPALPSNFEVIGHDPDYRFNCLGWAVGESIFPFDKELYKVGDKIHNFFTERGFETCSKEESEVDFWGFKATGEIKHWTRLYNGKWSSKGGNIFLFNHSRYALAGGKDGSPLEIYYRKKKTTAAAGHSKTLAMASVQEEEHEEMPVVEGVSPEDIALIQEHANLMASLPSLGAARTPVTHAPATRAPATSAHPPTTGTHPPTTGVKPPPAGAHPPTTGAKPPPAGAHPPTTGAKPPPAGAHPPTTGAKPPTTSPVVAEFAKTFATWKATWTLPEVKYSSSLDVLRTGSAYTALIKLGAAITPQLVQELAKDVRGYTVLPIHELNPGWKLKSVDIIDAKNEIIKLHASNVRTTNKSLALLSIRKDNVISAGLKGAQVAAELMKDPLFQAVVKTGLAAVPNILQARAKDGSTGQALWDAMLKEIHAIEQHGGPSQQQTQDFEQWLAGYLGVNIAPPAAPENPTEDTGVDPSTGVDSAEPASTDDQSAQ